MTEHQLAHTIKSRKPFAELIQAIEAEAQKRNFRTLHVHDVQQTLGEKGFVIEPYSIMEVCNAFYAHEVIQKYKPIGMMLPCRIVVYAEGPENTIILMRPSLMAELVTDAQLGCIPADVEKILVEVIEEAAK
jgi:uncharacterized protein (DUF302 family)